MYKEEQVIEFLKIEIEELAGLLLNHDSNYEMYFRGLKELVKNLNERNHKGPTDKYSLFLKELSVVMSKTNNSTYETKEKSIADLSRVIKKWN